MAAEAQALTPDSDPLEEIVRLGKAVGDRLRAGILGVLHQESYSVGELANLFNVPQPALSHHLKILHQAGLVARRREGNSIFYRRAALPPESSARKATGELLDSLAAAPQSPALHRRISAIHQARNQRSAEFFARNAEQITARQAEIAEPGAYLDPLLEMIDSAIADGLDTGQALEVGPGTGQLLVRLGARFDTATGIDNARAMLAATRAGIGSGAAAGNVRLRHRDFLTLPCRRRYDLLLAAMVIHHQASPASFFRQAANVLNPAGELVVVELCRHDQQWAADACGDQWLGFEPEELDGWAGGAGLAEAASQYLAQKNGFCIQIHRYRQGSRQPAGN